MSEEVTPEQEDQKEKKLSFVVMVTIAFINNTSALRVPVKDVDTGKNVLSEIEVVHRTGGTYYNEVLAIMFKTTELSHAFLGVERVT